MRTLLSAALLAPALGLVAPARRRSSRGATRRLAFDAALLFDCDGVLVETEELHRLAYNEAFAAFGLENGIILLVCYLRYRLLPGGVTMRSATLRGFLRCAGINILGGFMVIEGMPVVQPIERALHITNTWPGSLIAAR